MMSQVVLKAIYRGARRSSAAVNKTESETVIHQSRAGARGLRER